MARIRTIKPEFWSDSKTGTLSGDATKLFLGMLNFSDDYGVLENDIVALKAKIFPYRSDNPGDLVGRVLVDELFPKGLVIVMSFNQRGYLWIRNFEKHQRVDKPGEPLIPGFTREEAEKSIQNGSFDECSGNVRAGKEGKVREGKGREGSKACAETPKALVAVNEDTPVVLEFPVVGNPKAPSWPLREAKISEYRESFPGVDVTAECRKALQWLRDRPNRRKTLRGMPAFLSSWLGRAQNWARGPHRDGPRGGHDGRIVGEAAPVPGKYAHL